MKQLLTLCFAVVSLFSGQAALAASGDSMMLQSGDFVGYSFWLISMAMSAATIFFLMESMRIGGKWSTSLNVIALVCFIAAFHYFYMREMWVTTGDSPTTFRYIDWLLTVPLQLVEFYLILAAVAAVSGGIFWRIFIGSLVMLVPGYMGEAGYLNATVGFVIGMLGWAWILYELHAGEVGAAAESGSAGVQYGFNAMKWIVTVGWAIYPLGYMMGNGFFDGMGTEDMNILYNIADLVNKTAFGMMIWYAAKHDE